MAIKKETRIATSNTLEEWRIKSNEISLHLGDTDQLATDVGDKVFSTTASANAHKFSGMVCNISCFFIGRIKNYRFTSAIFCRYRS